MRTPAETIRFFQELVQGLEAPAASLPPRESAEAQGILRGLGGAFDKAVREDADNRPRLLDAIRDRLTELERLFSGQRLLFADSSAGRVATRFVEALALTNGTVAVVFQQLLDLVDEVESVIEADTLKALGVKPALAPRQRAPRKKAPKTYAKAQDDILRALAAKGWAVKSHLKTPHATNPEGTFRFWFKPQAIYFSKGGNVNDFGEARSMFAADYRTVETEAFVNGLLAYAKRHTPRL